MCESPRVPQNILTGRVAEGYDEASLDMYEPVVLEPTVRFLAEAAESGAALEFGIGTGRVALPLSQMGFRTFQLLPRAHWLCRSR